MKALSQNIKKLMSNKILRIKMGDNARKSMEKYSPNKIWSEWETLLEYIIKESQESFQK